MSYPNALSVATVPPAQMSSQQKEDLITSLLASLPRASLVRIKQRIDPLLFVDIVGRVPDEVALLVFSHLPCWDLLRCRIVCKQWQRLADDPMLWRGLCERRGYRWKDPSTTPQASSSTDAHSDDEGMGDEEELEFNDTFFDPINDSGLALDDTLWADSDSDSDSVATMRPDSWHYSSPNVSHSHRSTRTASPAPGAAVPDWRRLYLTRTVLRRRFFAGAFRQTKLQTRGTHNSHASTIYCLQLYTYPETGVQVLFTGSRDRTIREWNLATGAVQRVIEGVHEGSVLSLCARNGLLASAGSDGRTVIYDLASSRVLNVIQDHVDSVLCVRFDDKYLVSCSKDRSVRVYRLHPTLTPHQVLLGHRAAVNTIALSANHVISASGDKAVRIWDVESGKLLGEMENHHSRGIAAIDAAYPAIVTGSSDQHIRLVDVRNGTGWSTAAPFEPTHPYVDEEDEDAPDSHAPGQVCASCGAGANEDEPRPHASHTDLVRSVAMDADFVVSGSYDHRVKIWCRRTGRQLAELSGGHSARVFCVDFDATKVVSCGEDQNIVVWNFAHGLDTSFIPFN
ncbi:WD40 repeat-like protein [Peniophora sp. CONT]|nr:WD40 repeat-like protein [Peniophora sp. CONT]